MPPNILRLNTDYVLVKSVRPKVLWAESRVQGTGEYFPPLQFHAKIGEVVIGGVSISHPLGEFHRANSYCQLEVWFLPESVARVAAIVGDHHCHTPQHSFKETLDMFLGYSRPSSFHALPKLIWCGI
ncbi:uncharacterized protein TNCV_419341 [Trichonephila clavipes]|uniref:Uncharacterized protein n=1 Tax=Trichonephila clavipes TaxID=2585209 RepID=A0A8X6S4J8_TRICX|nr:uncharacterized protein TNCV_419341 [Trichonephila clavipes]